MLIIKDLYCLPPFFFFCHSLNRICWWITDRESVAPSYPSLPFIWMLGFTGRFILSLSIQLPSDPRARSRTPVYWTSYILQATMSIPLSVTAQRMGSPQCKAWFFFIRVHSGNPDAFICQDFIYALYFGKSISS